MSSFHLPRIAELDESAIARFREQGYLVVERVLDAGRIAELRDRFPKLFAGQFDTGVYPDEWYWREGMSLPNVTRHMANAWKSDLSVARLALSKDVGRAAARLAGWSGARLGQDTIWWSTQNQADSASPGHVVYRFPGSAGHGDVLGDVRRHASRRRSA
jgi:ectoine hydroxylase-related dioxygenase (phytanoyl-CoA dioxygenase family)